MAATSSSRARVLILLKHYLPGYRFGGPLRTVANLVEVLGSAFEFRVMCLDHDYGEEEPYPGVQGSSWRKVGSAGVLYLPRGLRGALQLLTVLRRREYDLLYVNSVFDRRFSMLPLLYWRARLAGAVPLLLAPRGELSTGALAQKRLRKRAYLWFVRRVGLYSPVTWQASTALEAGDIEREFGPPSALSARQADVPQWDSGGARPLQRVFIAPDVLAPAPRERLQDRNCRKTPGRARIAFVGRLVAMKNLSFALRVLGRVKGQVEFNIYGPLEDESYWRECEESLAQPGSDVRARYCGTLKPHAVLDTLAEHDLLFLPTLGENFGHVIAEALSVGCPVLTSDRTPWVGLQAACAGWDLPLERPDEFREALQECVDMDSDAHARLRLGAVQFIARTVDPARTVEQSRRMLAELCSSARRETG